LSTGRKEKSKTFLFSHLCVLVPPPTCPPHGFQPSSPSYFGEVGPAGGSGFGAQAAAVSIPLSVHFLFCPFRAGDEWDTPFPRAALRLPWATFFCPFRASLFLDHPFLGSNFIATEFAPTSCGTKVSRLPNLHPSSHTPQSSPLNPPSVSIVRHHRASSCAKAPRRSMADGVRGLKILALKFPGCGPLSSPFLDFCIRS